MGASRTNPNSPAFRLSNMPGTLPRLHLEAQLVVEVLPSDAWSAANRPAEEGGAWPVCPATDLVVHYRIKTAALFPSRFAVPAAWPKGECLTGEIDSLPLPLVMAPLIAANPQLGEPWAALVREDTERAEAAAKPLIVTP